MFDDDMLERLALVKPESRTGVVLLLLWDAGLIDDAAYVHAVVDTIALPERLDDGSLVC